MSGQRPFDILGVVNSVLTNLVTVAFALMTVAIVLQVFFRYVLKVPLEWSEELARALNLWLVFLGAAIATSKSEHVRVDLIDRVLNRLPPAVGALLNLLFLLSMWLFSLMIFGGAVSMARETWPLPLVTLPLTTGMLYLGLAVGFFMILVNLGGQILKIPGTLRRSKTAIWH